MIEKRSISMNFAKGLDLKTDPFQVPMGNFLSLVNWVFDVGARLTKRNGYGVLPALPNSSYQYLTTLNTNLTAIGPTISALSTANDSWVSKGNIQPLELATLPLIRNNSNQLQADSAVAANGLICTVYTEAVPFFAPHYKYAVADSKTGQNIIAPTLIPVSTGAVSGSPRVFVLGNYFIIVFTNLISATSHLQYIAVSTMNPAMVTANADLASAYIPSTNLSWDGVVSNNTLFLAYNTTSGGQSVKVTSLGPTLIQSSPVTFAGSIATCMTVTADETTANLVIYVSFYDSASSTGYTLAIDKSLATVLSPTQIISSGTILNLASAAQNGVCSVYSEVSNSYSYDSTIPTNFINQITVTQSGTLGTPFVLARSVGLASKAFIVAGSIYFLSAYQSPFQPTYFLINATASAPNPRPAPFGPVIAAKLAYENGGGYLTLGLPSVTVTENIAQVSYLYKDLIQALTTIGNPEQTTTGGIYSQTGINLASFDIGSDAIDTAEIGSVLQISGGFGWMYDGYLPVEENFFLWPDSVEGTAAASAGGMLAQKHYYQATYEWTDNQGNAYRSAPSIPIPVTVVAGSGLTFTSVFSTGATSITVSSASGLFVGQAITDTTTAGNITAGTYITSIVGTTVGLSQPTAGNSAVSPGDTLRTTQQGKVTINVPTLRMTYKLNNPVKIVIYRWSTAQPVYHQVTSVTIPTFNVPQGDSVSFVDTASDLAISGNNIIYTTGGVVEDVNSPASNLITLFDTRAWKVDAEDRNLLWFSKQVIEATPVEWSDLFTMYIPPTTASEGSTGPMTAIAPMDDKLIIFKDNAIYYINGTGPDNTGANNQYSQPIFITSTVGCSNQKSIVFMPNGLVFQSNKGIWLLTRDLQTNYLGANVDAFNTSIVQSAVNVPNGTQLRFTLDTGEMLMYDYFYEQWGTFVGAPAISSCIYQGLHTLINSSGAAYQETPGIYVDGTVPVLQSFETSWIQLAALQGFQRFYWFYFLGQYLSPHKLNVELSYNFISSPSQASIITPDNFSSATPSSYGEQPAPFGSPVDLEQWKIHAKIQKCQSFKISIQEIYDPSYGVPPGAGFTLSGLNMTVAMKKGVRPIRARNTAG